MRKILFLFVAVMVFVGLLVLFALLPASSGVMSEAEARAIAGAILPQVTGSHCGLVTDSETNLTVTVHVDMSDSMAGYVRPDTTFLKMIDYLARQWSPRLRAASTHYSGLDGRDYREDVGFFHNPLNYHGDHFMADTIQAFAKDPGRIHLLVTDSQPWDSGNNPAYDKVAGAINDFLSQGGRCVLILYRSPYVGQYRSPLFGSGGDEQVPYQCTNRPFAVWIFAHAGCALNRVVEDLASQTGALRWADKAQFGEPELLLTLAGRTLSTQDAIAGKEIGTTNWVKTGKEVGRVRDYQMIQIMKKALDDQGYAPLQFDLAPFTAEQAGRNWARVRSGLSVTLDCWALPGRIVLDGNNSSPASRGADGMSGVSGQTNALAKTNAASTKACPPLHLEKVLHSAPEHVLLFVTNAPATNAAGVVTPEIVSARLVVPVLPRPSSGRRYAWVLTVNPKFTGSSRVLPDGFSTPDDRNPSQCDRILKLDEMLSIVAGQTDKLGSVLFLTDF